MVLETRAWALGLWDAGVCRCRPVLYTVPTVGLAWIQATGTCYTRSQPSGYHRCEGTYTGFAWECVSNM